MHRDFGKRYDFESAVRAFVREVVASREGEAAASAFVRSEGCAALLGALEWQLRDETLEFLEEFRDNFEAQVLEAYTRWSRCRRGLAQGRDSGGRAADAEVSAPSSPIFPIPLTLLTAHEREQTELFAQWLSSRMRQRVASVLALHAVRAEQIAQVLEVGVARGCVARWAERTSPTFVLREGVVLDLGLLQRARVSVFPRGDMYGVELPSRIGVGLAVPSPSGEVLWVLTGTACLGCPVCRFVADLFGVLRYLCRVLGFWRWDEVYEAGLYGGVLPARAGVCRCALGDGLYTPVVSWHMLPFYAPETVKRVMEWIYEAVLSRLEARSWAQLMDANASLRGLREWLEVVPRWDIEHLWQEWRRHAPAEWQYESSSGKRVFGNALRRAWGRLRSRWRRVVAGLFESV